MIKIEVLTRQTKKLLNDQKTQNPEKVLKFFFLPLLLLFVLPVYSQPQWKFHVAFEDAIGAKDTIWFIWDTTATFYGVDTALGEVSAHLNYLEFNVWTHNYGLTWYDTIKTVAHPYTYSFGHRIEAINFELPITISWDSSLLHADWLPPDPVGWVNFARINNDYFFFYNNMEFDQQFDMTRTHQVTAPEPDNTDPWVWQHWVHFPMEIYLNQDPTVSIDYEMVKVPNSLTVFPNPFYKTTTVEFYLNEQSHVLLSVYNLNGKLIKILNNKLLSGGKNQIKWSGLNHAGQACEPGFYIVYLEVSGTFKQSIILIIN